MKSLTPVYNRVVIKKKATSTTTAGIFIPESARMGSMQVSEGTVLAIGETVDETIKVGATVIWGKYAGMIIKRDKEEVTILNDNDIIGIIND